MYSWNIFPPFALPSSEHLSEGREAFKACSILLINLYIFKVFRLYLLQGQGLYIPVLIVWIQSRAMEFQESMLSQ